MKAYLIDPSHTLIDEDFIQEIQIDSWRDIVPAIGGKCQLCSTVRIDENNVLYVDDEGLMNGQIDDVGFFILKDYDSPLAGRGVVLGCDFKGESVDTSIERDKLAEIVGQRTNFGTLFYKDVQEV